MEFQFAKRIENFGENIFNTLNTRRDARLAEGKKVYNLSIGTPDFAPEPHVIEAVVEAAKNPQNYKYSLKEIPELLAAVQNWYQRRYQIDLAQNEIMSIYGSQEGIAHLALAICDPGDVVLVPNPGYPIFEIGPFFCGAKLEYYNLYPENNYILDFATIDEEVAKKAKMMIVSYPLNPVCAVAPKEFYEELVAFAKKYNIIIVHDNAYSDITFGGKGFSFLNIEGAKEVGIELNSLSKTYNLTGARMSFVLGNAQIIKAFKTIRSQIDYGSFLPVQHAAIAALNGSQAGVEARCNEYEARKNALCQGLAEIGWQGARSEGTMFVWAPIPANFATSEEFCLELLEKAGVICTPGNSFGSLGEGYVRFALVEPVPVIEALIADIKNSGIIK